jgi:hypothetical protein
MVVYSQDYETLWSFVSATASDHSQTATLVPVETSANPHALCTSVAHLLLLTLQLLLQGHLLLAENAEVGG